MIRKKLAMYEDFLKQFASNPAAVAPMATGSSRSLPGRGGPAESVRLWRQGRWPVRPHSLDILVSRRALPNKLKNNAKLLDYAWRGGEVYNSIGKRRNRKA